MARKIQGTTLGDWAYLAIAKHYKKILSHEAGVFAARDPEELHQMRVGMRRLRSVLVGFSPAFDLPKSITQERIGRYGQILGKLRDLDVMRLALTETYFPHLPKAEKKILKTILKQLLKQRRQQVKKVHQFLKSATYLGFKNDVQAWLDKPQYRAIASVDISLVLPDLLLPQLSKLLLHEGWWVGNAKQKFTPPQLDQLLHSRGVILHDLRKTAKRSRYNRELFEQFYGGDYHEQLKAIKQIQTIIGIFQDDDVLMNFLRRSLPKTHSKYLPTVTKIFQENRWQTWHKWTKLRSQFREHPSLELSRNTQARGFIKISCPQT